jgi:hypothetical protein
MRRLSVLGIIMVLVLGGMVFVGKQVSAQNPAPTVTPLVEYNGDGMRSVNTSSSLSPSAITSLPMSNPFCSQPDPSVNKCAVNVRYWQANDNGTGNVLAYVLFSIDGKLRYRSNAFFENFVSYTYDMIPGGIQVSCGLPNAGGYGTLYGNGYTVDVKAFDVTNNWVLDDQLLVRCPAFNP